MFFTAFGEYYFTPNDRKLNEPNQRMKNARKISRFSKKYLIFILQYDIIFIVKLRLLLTSKIALSGRVNSI